MTENDLRAMRERLDAIERKFEEMGQARRVLAAAESECRCARVTLWLAGEDMAASHSLHVPGECLPRLQKFVAGMMREWLPQAERELEAMRRP